MWMTTTPCRMTWMTKSNSTNTHCTESLHACRVQDTTECKYHAHCTDEGTEWVATPQPCDPRGVLENSWRCGHCVAYSSSFLYGNEMLGLCFKQASLDCLHRHASVELVLQKRILLSSKNWGSHSWPGPQFCSVGAMGQRMHHFTHRLGLERSCKSNFRKLGRI